MKSAPRIRRMINRASHIASPLPLDSVRAAPVLSPPGSPLPRPFRQSRPRRDPLPEAEQPVRVVAALHLHQAWEVGAVVGGPPVREIRVDVVLVGEARDEGPHRGMEAADPTERGA